MTFELTKQEAEVVLNALAQLPFAHVAALITKLQQQAQAQLAEEQDNA
mgnify:CR=1